MCDKVTAIVDGLKAEHADTIEIETVKVGDGDSQKEIEESDPQASRHHRKEPCG